MAFDLQIFNTQTYIAYTETLNQYVNLFNQATQGGLTLVPSMANQGDYSIRASFKLISGLVRRRDVKNGTTAITTKRLEQLKDQSVKVPSGTPEILWEAAQYTWVRQNPSLAAAMIGEQLAQATLADMLNTAIAGTVSSMKNVPAVNHAASSTMTFSELTTGAGKFGDRQMGIACWVMHSTPMTALFNNALTNAERLFTYGTVNVIADPFGRPLVMTDSDKLVTTVSGNTKYLTLGLVQGGVMVERNGDFNANVVTKNGTENIQTSYQAEWSYNLGVLGYTYRGPAAPTDAQIADSTSWEKTATSIKDTAGVLITSS